MGSYSKYQKGDNNTANEQLAHNRIFIDMHGAGPLTMAIFCCCVLGAAIGWMMLHEAGLVIVMITASFVAFFLGAGAIGGMFVIRYYSGTKRQLATDRAAEAWESLIHYTDSHIIARDPRLRIESAREISEVRHYNDRPQISEQAESLGSSYDMPSVDLLK